MKNSLLNNPSIDDQEILKKLCQVFHEYLKEKPHILAFLTEKNHLIKDEIEAFQIGFSSDALQPFVGKNNLLRERLKRIGFLNGDSRKYFSTHIIFPVIDQFGIIRDVIGYKYFLYSTDRKRVKYLKNPPFVKVEENIRQIITILAGLRTKSQEEVRSSNDLFFQFGDKTYRIRGLSAENPKTLSVNFQAVKEEQKYIDTLDLYSAKVRRGLVARLAELFEDPAEAIEKDLLNLVEKLDEIKQKMGGGKESIDKPPEITVEERERALAILKKADLLSMIREDLTKIGIAGEDRNKVMLYMTFTSRKLRKPLSVIVKGDSAGGKSYLVSLVLKLFPSEDIKNFTEVSAKSLFYMSEDALKNKILVIYERHGSESSDYSIRSLQSEDKLKLAVTMRDPKTSEFRTVEKTVKGPISYAETTTKLSIHAENETRVFNIFIDESSEQTGKIFSIQDLVYLPEERMDSGLTEGIIKKHHLLQRVLEPVKVMIPYVREITFPTDKLRLRRDRMRFLALIETFAFLYQFQRDKVKIRDEEYIRANLEDYRMAYELAEVIMKETLSALHPKTKDLLGFIRDLSQPFTLSDIQNVSGWNSMRIRRYLKQLMEEEYIEAKSSGQGKRGIFVLCEGMKTEKDALEGLPTPDGLRKKLLHFNTVGVKVAQTLKTTDTASEKAI